MSEKTVPEGTDSSETDTAVSVDIYVITETERLGIPENFCKECNLFVNVAKEASKEVQVPVDVEVYSWWANPLSALKHGGYHPPVMVIDGTRISQGEDIPSKERVIQALTSSLSEDR